MLSEDRYIEQEWESEEKFSIPSVISGKRKAEIAVNKKGNLWVICNQPLEGFVSWMEYDASDHSLYIIMTDGRYYELGIKVPENMRKWMLRSKMALFVLLDSEKKILKQAIPVTLVYKFR